MFHTIDNTALAFTALDRRQQAAIWISFFDALDSGVAGHHPFYAELAWLYAAGDYPCEAALAFELAVEIDDLALAAELDDEPPY